MTEEHLLKGWNEFEAGATLFSFNGNPEKRDHHINNSFHHSVSDWRINKPVFNEAHCIHCQFCWVWCPDTSIVAKDKKFDHIDYVHCKGCGICVDVCPTNPKSLLMFAEATPLEEAVRNWPAKEDKKKKD